MPIDPTIIEDAQIDAEVDAILAGEGEGSVQVFTKARDTNDPMVPLEKQRYVYIQHQHTGRVHEVPPTMLRSHLKQRFPKNNPYVPDELWSTNVWKQVAAGTPHTQTGQKLKCWLHPESPMRQQCDALGFTHLRCPQDHCPHMAALDRHMESKHPSVYKAYERDKAEKDRERQKHNQEQQNKSQEALVELLTHAIGAGSKKAT